MTYKILRHTPVEGWTVWSSPGGEPFTFATQPEAQAAIDQYIAHTEEQILEGDRHSEDTHDRKDFRIVDGIDITAALKTRSQKQQKRDRER